MLKFAEVAPGRHTFAEVAELKKEIIQAPSGSLSRRQQVEDARGRRAKLTGAATRLSLKTIDFVRVIRPALVLDGRSRPASPNTTR